MFNAMPKTIFLHILMCYICLLTFLRPVNAVSERGVEYVDNYDPASTEEHDWHKRMNGVDVVEITAERASAARADVDWHAPPKDDSNNGNDWGKRGTSWNNKRGDSDVTGGDGEGPDKGSRVCKNKKRMERANAAGQGGYVKPDDAQEGSEWGKRGTEGTCAACVKRDNIMGNAPPADDTNGGPYQTHDEEAEESRDWLMKRSGNMPFQAPAPFAPPVGRVLKMSKRGVIEEWMHPHAIDKRQSCLDPGWEPCADTFGCCATSSLCCGTFCMYEGGQCCEGGISCEKGNICVLLNGEPECCTDLSCTAWISDGVKVPFTWTSTVERPDTTPTSPPTTAPPDTNTAGDATIETGDGQEQTVQPEDTGRETPVPLPTQTTTSRRTTSSITGPINGDGPSPTGGSAGMVKVNRWLSCGMVGVAMVAGVGMVWL